MFASNLYGRLVYYLEACESGSMFQDLPSNLNIYAVSAANATESSWAAYWYTIKLKIYLIAFLVEVKQL